MDDRFRSVLQTFENPYPQRDYTVEIVCPEFTSVCPKTGQPDFGTLRIVYVPDARCVELKSLKLYLHQYRNEGIYYEAAANRILDDLAAVLRPRRMTLTAAFTPRGGITTTVTASCQLSAVRGCEKMGTGASPDADSPGFARVGSEPVPIFSQPLSDQLSAAGAKPHAATIPNP